ncbi:contractile injection system protein, VgrG/Pvc8 family [Caballeronia sp. PC1]|uniref:contractile injection system protein, VgrG/Pvc8 family n=1 Tax=Caballeronia sp. PC1 TaxID=2906765 RepID=UPI001F37D4AF|nr:contractile injection system protein, VgrG/Pvc8 family [Caballeronia sp. PC1]MCE4547182.1 DUF3304 domain-containing protein [Caballeronia sp. PC1]
MCKALPLWGGEDVLIPERLSGTEALGELFKYQVEFATLDIPSFRVYQAREAIKPDDLIGRLIEISVEFEGKGTFVPGLPGDLGAGNIGAGVRIINGIITEVEQTGSDERRAYYRFTVRPWLWMTTQSIDNRVFQNLNVIEITEAVFKSRNFKFPWNWRVAAVALKNNVFPKRDYVRQFWQTDYDFLCQIWSEWGIYYHFDGMTLVLCDSPGSHKKHGNTYDTIRYHAPEDKRIDEEHIHALTVSRQITPGDVTLESPAKWYKAENVRIAHYDTNKTAGAWLIFLPDDRVRLMVVDGKEGGNDPDKRPPDDDPLIVKGVVDTEWNERFPNGVVRGLQR